LKVAYVSGDDLMGKIDSVLAKLRSGGYGHLDQENEAVGLADLATSFLKNEALPIVSANAYLGYRERL
jgi:hypothetical protein